MDHFKSPENEVYFLTMEGHLFEGESTPSR